MKKVISSLVALIMILSFATTAQGANIVISSPLEAEIAPTRDFYVVGTINRDGKSAKEQPLNIRVRLNNSKGETVRMIESNVGPDGLTSGTYFLTDYEYGSSTNDVRNQYINEFTPPDIIYDGVDRDSIRLAYNKIVVKENYFAAIIYGGATKDFDLNYVDKYGSFLSDITEGEYELIITAVDLYGDEVCRTTQTIKIGTDKERVIGYASDNDLVSVQSVVGFWDPARYTSEKTNLFSYVVDKRLLDNVNAEYSNLESVNIVLNYLDTTQLMDNLKLGSVFSSESIDNITYSYYDIGDSSVRFDFADASLVKKGEVVNSKSSSFIEICRADTWSYGEDTCYVDFNMDDGVIIKDGTIFYGVYTPVGLTATLSNATYKLKGKIANIKAVVTDKQGNEFYSQIDDANLVREDSSTKASFEFGVSIIPNDEMLQAENVVLTFYAIDSDGKELLQSDPIELKVVGDGAFITGYDETYWGKMFCDTVNSLGETASGEALVADSHITRGDFATMINRLLGFYVSGKSKFSDLSSNDVFYDECITAQQIGYMTGDEKGQIRADQLISREEAMIILARISGAEKGDVTVEFEDSDDISFWAKEYVDIMCSTGIVAGFNGYLNPLDSITVAEAAALIVKTIKWMYSPESEIKHNDIVQEDSDDDDNFTDVSADEFFSEFSEENADEFFLSNKSIFTSLSTYLQKNFSDGAYINKVGNGLEIRDYKLGGFLTLSDNALNLITQISKNFVVFSIKYNPTGENAISFTFGKDDNGKEYGIVYTEADSLKNKSLQAIDDNWYYFIQQ